MFGFGKKRKEDQAPEAAPAPEQPGFFGRLKQGLTRTRSGFTGLFAGRKVDAELLEDLETRLLMADVGVEATEAIMADLGSRVARHQLQDVAALTQALRDRMTGMLAPCEQPLEIPEDASPFVILMVGVNGAGKTTTIGKLTRRLQEQGASVVLAAGDTFRAAAVEQLKTWGERHDVPVIAQPRGADSASVAFDALEAARARKADVLIVDTAGRLHTQANLMEELRKIKRVLGKKDPAVPHETLLVVDAGTGQNALAQAKQFHEAIGLTGVAITKLDGTAKGGVVLAMAERFGLPIRFIGVGESAEDLRTFEAADFVDALLSSEDSEAAGSANA